MSKLIGLEGKKGVGKDVVGRWFHVHRGALRVAFADPIREALAAMFGVPVELFSDPELKEVPNALLLGHTPRYLMQTLGTEWGRTYVGADMWLQLAKRKAEATLATGRAVVITDVRFDNEAEMIHEMGGEVWRIVRDRQVYVSGDRHVSEAGVKSQLISRTIDNNGNFDALFENVFNAMSGPNLH